MTVQPSLIGCQVHYDSSTFANVELKGSLENDATLTFPSKLGDDFTQLWFSFVDQSGTPDTGSTTFKSLNIKFNKDDCLDTDYYYDGQATIDTEV